MFDIDTTSNTIAGVLTDFGGPSSPNGLSIAGGRAYVAASFQSPGVAPGEGIAVIDIATRTFITKTNVVDPILVEASTDGSRVWTHTLGESRLITIDTATSQIIGRRDATGAPLDLAAIPTQRFADIAVDQPAAGAIVQEPFSVSGWAVDVMGLLPGPGVSTVHVWAFPASGGAPTFVGADYGRPRPDVSALFGPSFANSGYGVTVRGLPPGEYQLIAFAFSVRTGQFSIARTVPVTIRASPWLVVDTPQDGSSVSTPFTIAGWALDAAAATGTGVDAVHVWAYPTAGGAPVFAGAGALGDARPDVGAFFGAQFANAGFHLEVSTLAPGTYTLVVYGHSAVTGAFSVEQHVRVTVPARQPLMWIDTPAASAMVGSTFAVSGWAVEFNAAAGTGVDIVHIWATSPSGVATFLGAATYGVSRPDVGAWLGPRYSASGFSLDASLSPGSYTLSIYARSTETGTFRQWKTVADNGAMIETVISGHRQRLVELAVAREAERLVEMQRRVVVGADVEADRLDAGELAEHRARDQASESPPTPIAPGVDIAHRRDTFLASQQVRPGGRHQHRAFIDPMEHAVVDHRGKEEIGRLARGLPVGIQGLECGNVARAQPRGDCARRSQAITGPRHSPHQTR